MIKNNLLLGIFALFSVSLAFADTTTLKLCNDNPDRRIYVARMIDAGGTLGWQSSGWYVVEKTQCRDLSLGTYSGKVYLYADDEFQETFWGDGDVGFCINTAAAFSIPGANLADCTQPNLKKVKSDEVTVSGGTTVWNFKPNLSKINFCNQNAKIDVFTNFAKMGTDGWFAKGWYLVKAGMCELVTVGRYVGEVRYYGEYNGGEYTWGTGPGKYCINRTAAFQFNKAEDETLCTGVEKKMVLSSSISVGVGTTQVDLAAVELKTVLKLCNKTKDLSLSASYGVENTVPKIKSAGWISLAARQCKEIDLAGYTGSTYVYAETAGGTQYWGNGPVEVCVNKKADFTIDDSADGVTCKANKDLKMVPTTVFTVGNGVNEFSFM